MGKPQQPETTFVTSDWAAVADVHRFAHQAMATTFEAIIQYEDKSYARQAAQAAFDEVDRLERDLSRFLENSDVARINNSPAKTVSFGCTKTSVTRLTMGAASLISRERGSTRPGATAAQVLDAFWSARLA